jgi:hypothetical protein
MSFATNAVETAARAPVNLMSQWFLGLRIFWSAAIVGATQRSATHRFSALYEVI